MKESFVAWVYIIAWKLLRMLPEKTAYSLFDRGAKWLVKRDGKSVRRLRKNLARVSTDLSDVQLNSLLEEAMSSYMRYWCDTFRFPNWNNDRINETVTVTREELLLDGIKSGRGVIVALPHAGNWDHAGAYFCAMGFPLVTVAERLKPEALFNKFLEYRQNMGMEVLSTDSKAMGTLMQRARDGALIALVGDRDLSRSGVDVNFFGHPARMPAGAALLAVRTGIPLITAFVTYTKSGIHIEFNSVSIPSEGAETERVSKVVQN
jgi:KDO2-lipid IV(A) lauroyltransferase